MITIYCSTCGLRYSYMVSALWLKPFESPIHYSKQTTSVVCFFVYIRLLYTEPGDYIGSPKNFGGLGSLLTKAQLSHLQGYESRQAINSKP